jgi:uncharacterized membrane protein YedE/YeeE
MTKGLAAFVCGVVFALGLALGGMTTPSRVLAFLDVAGAWDPSLAAVMAGAVATYALLRGPIERRRRPVLATAFDLPSRRDLDGALIGGAALFGIGWGMIGFCPGPALVGAGAGVPEAVIFVAAMAAGMGIR